MTQKAQKSFRSLTASTARYSGDVQKKLSGRTAKKPNSALVESAAKYYEALKKLADG